MSRAFYFFYTYVRVDDNRGKAMFALASREKLGRKWKVPVATDRIKCTSKKQNQDDVTSNRLESQLQMQGDKVR